MNSAGERVEARGNLSRWGGFLEAQRWAEPSRKSSGQASGQSIDCPRTNAWPCFSARYTLRRGILCLLWVAPVQNVAREQQCYPQRMIVFTAGTYVRVYCISFREIYIPVIDYYALHAFLSHV